MITRARMEERLPLLVGKNDPLLDPVQKLARISRSISLPGALQLGLKVRNDARGKPRTQIGRKGELPDELASQGGSPCSRRSVVRVHQAVRLLPQQPIAERRRRRSGHFPDLDDTRIELLQEHAQVGEVKLVPQAGPPCLEEQGEIVVARYRGEQGLCPLAREPERHASPRRRPRKEQSPAGAFAKPGAEEAAAFQAPAQEPLQAARLDKGKDLMRGARLGQEEKDRIVVLEHLGTIAVLFLPRGGESETERLVDPSAPHRMQDDILRADVLGGFCADVPGGFRARLAVGIPRMLDEQMMAMGKVCAGCLSLSGKELGHRARRIRLQAVGGLQRGREGRLCDFPIPVFQRTRDPVGDVEIPVALLRFPEGGHADPRCHGHDLDVLVIDLLYPPALRAEHEAVAKRAFPDKLFVQLADESLGIRGAQAEVAPVGNGAPAGGQPDPRTFPGAHRGIDAIIGNHRCEITQPCFLVLAGEHVQHEIELPAGERVVGKAGANEVVQLIHFPDLHRGHGDDHLGQNIQRAGHGCDRVDVLLPDAACGDGRIHDVLAVQRENDAPAGLPDRVTGAAETLDGGRHTEGGLYENDLIEGAHVNAKLQGAGGNDGFQLAALQPLLDHQAKLP